MDYVSVPQRQVPVCADVDLCVIGGGVTGVFAAVRAARLGLKVALVERFSSFGGMAANARVNIWHSLYNTTGEKQIIAGLTEEVIRRLQSSGAADHTGRVDDRIMFNSDMLKCILDDLILESKVKPFLHSFYAGIEKKGDAITAVLICGKDGLRAIKAAFFIDTTGDGDLARDLGLKGYRLEPMQPPTPVFLLQGDTDGLDLTQIYHSHTDEFDLGRDFCAGWHQDYPNCRGITTRADLHVSALALDRADVLTQAEIEARQKIRGMVQLLNKYGKPGETYQVVSMSNCIGIRDTVHFETRYRANELDLLLGRAYDDTILQGTYNIDIHCAYGSGIIFKQFDGTVHRLYPQENRSEYGNWRTENNIDEKEYPVATYYQLPFSNLVNESYRNFIAAGRMIHADIGSFGALRVMVNLNQLGEAAGVAAYAALHRNKPLQDLDGTRIRAMLRSGGSAL